jgi:class 3 adenylate cyclase
MAEERINRKLAAILAADVVGYSRLMASDETVFFWTGLMSARRALSRLPSSAA